MEKHGNAIFIWQIPVNLTNSFSWHFTSWVYDSSCDSFLWWTLNLSFGNFPTSWPFCWQTSCPLTFHLVKWKLSWFLNFIDSFSSHLSFDRLGYSVSSPSFIWPTPFERTMFWDDQHVANSSKFASAANRTQKSGTTSSLTDDCYQLPLGHLLWHVSRWNRALRSQETTTRCSMQAQALLYAILVDGLWRARLIINHTQQALTTACSSATLATLVWLNTPCVMRTNKHRKCLSSD